MMMSQESAVSSRPSLVQSPSLLPATEEWAADLAAEACQEACDEAEGVGLVNRFMRLSGKSGLDWGWGEEAEETSRPLTLLTEEEEEANHQALLKEILIIKPAPDSDTEDTSM